jgi:hypothetical protein
MCGPRAKSVPPKRDRGANFLIVAVSAAFVAVFCAGCARADGDIPNDDSLLRKAAKAGGLATDVEPAKDFVVKTRPANADYVPIFRPPFEQAIKAKTPDELKALEADFTSVQARHDAARAAFPPAAKALAEKKAADAAKVKKKKLPPDAPPPQ